MSYQCQKCGEFLADLTTDKRVPLHHFLVNGVPHPCRTTYRLWTEHLKSYEMSILGEGTINKIKERLDG